MQTLANLNTIVVTQRKEWGEILTGFESHNKYAVTDPRGNQIYFAAEHAGSVLARLFLKSARPFEMSILRPGGAVALRLNRPFRFYFHEIAVHDERGALLGTVKKELSLLRRHFTVTGTTGHHFAIFGPLLRPWTFIIRENGQDVGKITKRWSGLLKEGFTDADNFAIEFPTHWTPSTKAVFLGAVFLIDFIHFEKR